MAAAERRKNRLKDLAANPNLISGIYNYCDRWCERCSFTSRCLLYATEQDDPELSDPEVRDLNNEKFWRKLRSIFAETAEMITEWAVEAGVDLDSIDATEEMAEHERALDDARQDQMSRLATEYANDVQTWFQQEFSTEEDIRSDASPNGPAVSIDVTAAQAAEVIQWYQFFIAVKLMRALTSVSEVDEDDFQEEDFLSFDIGSASEAEDGEEIDYDEILARSSLIDANGSAKTALIAIDRSLAAWHALQVSLPEKSATIKPKIIQLDQLRRLAEGRFPHARDFVRPGFDEVQSEFEN